MKYKVNNESFNPSLNLDGEPEAEYVVKSEDDKIVDFVKFIQAMEGLEVGPEEEAMLRKALKGEISEEEAIKNLISE